MGRGLIHTQQYLASHHHTCDFGLVGLAGYQGSGVLAAAQHGDIIREFQDFAQFVRDKDNGLALVHQAAQYAKELKCLLRRQHTGRFIHNQDVSSAIKDFEYLDSLL